MEEYKLMCWLCKYGWNFSRKIKQDEIFKKIGNIGSLSVGLGEYRSLVGNELRASMRMRGEGELMSCAIHTFY